MGYPSTYLVEKQELSKIFQQLRKVYAPANGYWVVEFADGILQRETALLLQDPDVQKHIHKLVFCAHDAVGVIGGIQVLKQRFGLEPDAISGYCSSSPLAVQEFRDFINIPVFDSMQSTLKEILDILL